MQMARIVLFLLALSAAVLAQSADTGTAQKAAATALLNSNNSGAARLACPATISAAPTSNPPGGGRGRGAAGPASTPARDSWYAEGGQVFENLYLLTTKTNSAWAVNTSAGIILIDTLFAYAAQDEIVDGLKKVGLDPANIKYIIVRHAHGDHDGSVKFLQDTYNPRIINGFQRLGISRTGSQSTAPRYGCHGWTEADSRRYNHHDLHHPTYTRMRKSIGHEP
jgi:metallo-beta-lactamase class B